MIYVVGKNVRYLTGGIWEIRQNCKSERIANLTKLQG